MNKYLEKIAEKEKKESKFHPGKALGSLLLGGTVANLGILPGQIILANKVIGKINKPSDSGANLHTVRKFMKDNNLHKDVTFNTRKHSVDGANFHGPTGQMYREHVMQNARGGSPAFMSKGLGRSRKGFVVGARTAEGKAINPDVLMHELGHAKDFSKGTGLKTLLSNVRRPAIQALIGGATIGALSNEKTRDYAPVVAAVPGLITLREEGAANYHAYKGIKAHMGSSAANKFVKKLLPHQMGSYALGAAAPVAGAYLAKKIMEKWTAKKKK